jgi:hypothetical protein
VGTVKRSEIDVVAGSARVKKYEPALPGQLIEREMLSQWVSCVLVEPDAGELVESVEPSIVTILPPSSPPKRIDWSGLAFGSLLAVGATWMLSLFTLAVLHGVGLLTFVKK